MAVFLLMGGLRVFTGEQAGLEMEAVAGTVTRPIAIALLAVFIGYIWLLTRAARKSRDSQSSISLVMVSFGSTAAPPR